MNSNNKNNQRETKYLFGLQESTAKLLKEQVLLEFTASAQYLTMASWCETRGYVGSSNFFYKQSLEEREHMLKIFKFLVGADCYTTHPVSCDIVVDFGCLREVFEMSLENEIKVTQSIHRMVSHCSEIKDFSTHAFLQWYVTEQMEEESTVKGILDMFDLGGDTYLGVFTIDKSIGDMLKK